MKITVDDKDFNVDETSFENNEFIDFPMQTFWNNYFDKNPIAKNVVKNLKAKGYKVEINLQGNTTSC